MGGKPCSAHARRSHSLTSEMGIGSARLQRRRVSPNVKVLVNCLTVNFIKAGSVQLFSPLYPSCYFCAKL